jgi:hypothetical protein
MKGRDAKEWTENGVLLDASGGLRHMEARVFGEIGD